VSARYVVRPKADQDLDDQAYYLATQANPEVSHKFLLAAHETFSLLATQRRREKIKTAHAKSQRR
jgi:plasmid stabilization system protein ParE